MEWLQTVGTYSLYSQEPNLGHYKTYIRKSEGGESWDLIPTMYPYSKELICPYF